MIWYSRRLLSKSDIAPIRYRGPPLPIATRPSFWVVSSVVVERSTESHALSLTELFLFFYSAGFITDGDYIKVLSSVWVNYIAGLDLDLKWVMNNWSCVTREELVSSSRWSWCLDWSFSAAHSSQPPRPSAPGCNYDQLSFSYSYAFKCTTLHISAKTSSEP